MQYITATTLEKNDEYNSMVTMALFDKLNWVIREIQNIEQQFIVFNKKLHSLENIRKSNLLAFKLEIRELLQQQDLKTEKLLWQMEQEVFKKMELQEIITKNTSLAMENLQNFNVVSLKQNRNWQTILRRQDGSQNFNLSWHDYKTGFGNVNGEFFIGLEKLHALTTYADPHELLIILQDFDNQTRYAKYSDFVIGSENENYQIKKIDKFQGDANDSLSQHLNCGFSTYDRDNDNTTTSHCAKVFQGGWWFSSCYNSHLTGPYVHQSNITSIKEKDKGIIWNSWHGLNYSLKYAEMLIRPK
ncbi:fibrinogen-like protein 1 [Calliphora vicina]|uniref:fibrinogen-like protein 1 n=1 Tax=Calliphora vicina TaxID=7373 RepID=UPI00325ABEC9